MFYALFTTSAAAVATKSWHGKLTACPGANQDGHARRKKSAKPSFSGRKHHHGSVLPTHTEYSVNHAYIHFAPGYERRWWFAQPPLEMGTMSFSKPTPYMGSCLGLGGLWTQERQHQVVLSWH